MLRPVRWMCLGRPALALAPSAALAQTDLTGAWGSALLRGFSRADSGSRYLGDYVGLPITEGARQLGVQLGPVAPDAAGTPVPGARLACTFTAGPCRCASGRERDPDTQQLIAIKNYISTFEQTRTIWMDGRPHPPDYAAHTWEGFSTGRFEGDMLTVTTTHIKQGWLRRNGLPESDRATLSEHFVRHGSNLTHISVVTDPVYLTEPLIKTENFTLIERTQFGPGAWLLAA